MSCKTSCAERCLEIVEMLDYLKLINKEREVIPEDIDDRLSLPGSAEAEYYTPAAIEIEHEREIIHSTIHYLRTLLDYNEQELKAEITKLQKGCLGPVEWWIGDVVISFCGSPSRSVMRDRQPDPPAV